MSTRTRRRRSLASADREGVQAVPPTPQFEHALNCFICMEETLPLMRCPSCTCSVHKSCFMEYKVRSLFASESEFRSSAPTPTIVGVNPTCPIGHRFFVATAGRSQFWHIRVSPKFRFASRPDPHQLTFAVAMILIGLSLGVAISDLQTCLTVAAFAILPMLLLAQMEVDQDRAILSPLQLGKWVVALTLVDLLVHVAWGLVLSNARLFTSVLYLVPGPSMLLTLILILVGSNILAFFSTTIALGSYILTLPSFYPTFQDFFVAFIGPLFAHIVWLPVLLVIYLGTLAMTKAFPSKFAFEDVGFCA